MLPGSGAQVIIHRFTDMATMSKEPNTFSPARRSSGHEKYGEMVIARRLGLLESFSWRID